MCYLKADREWSTTGKRLEPGMVPPGIIQNREWPDREWPDREWSTTETRLGEIRLTEVRRPGKGLLPRYTVSWHLLLDHLLSATCYWDIWFFPWIFSACLLLRLILLRQKLLTKWFPPFLQIGFLQLLLTTFAPEQKAIRDICYPRHLLSETFAIWDNYYLLWYTQLLDL